MTRVKYDRNVKGRENVLRSILPIRNVGKIEFDIVRWWEKDPKGNESAWAKYYQMYKFACGWYTNEKDDIADREKEIAKRNIFSLEDHCFICGESSLGLIGIDSTKTIRTDLYNTIKEFSPCSIITSSRWLDPCGIDVHYCPYIPKYEHYIIPAKSMLDPEVAEFVISEDLHEESPYLGEDGKWWHCISEWATVEIHKPDEFVRVCRPYISQIK
jgi:hypothetical protein